MYCLAIIILTVVAESRVCAIAAFSSGTRWVVSYTCACMYSVVMPISY